MSNKMGRYPTKDSCVKKIALVMKKNLDLKKKKNTKTITKINIHHMIKNNFLIF